MKQDTQRQEAIQQAKEEYEAKLREQQRLRDEEEAQRLEKQRTQDKLREICPCPAGFQYFRQNGGWRCGGGSHFVSDEQMLG